MGKNEANNQIYENRAVRIGDKSAFTFLPAGISLNFIYVVGLLTYYRSQIPQGDYWLLISGLGALSALWLLFISRDYKVKVITNELVIRQSVLSFLTSLMIGLIGAHLHHMIGGFEGSTIQFMLFVMIAVSTLTTGKAPPIMVTWILGLTMGSSSIYIDGFTVQSLVYTVSFIIYLTIVHIHTSYSYNKFKDQLVSEMVSRDQKEIISLLLKDFEDGAGDWLWELDETYAISYVSKHLCDSLGVERTFFHGRNIFDTIRFFTTNSETLQANEVLSLVENKLRSHEVFREVELPFHYKGDNYVVQFSAKPKYDKEGRFQGWRGVGRNVTLINSYKAALEYRADYDSLTGLYNRNYIEYNLNTPSESSDAKNMLVAIEISNNKDLFSMVGYENKNKILKQIASVLTDYKCQSTACARIETNTFALLITEHRENPNQCIENLWHYLTDQDYSAITTFDIKFSIGAVEYDPDTPVFETVIQNANLALTKARGDESKPYRLYLESMKDEVQNRLSLISDLGKALRRDEFELVYQPQKDAATGHYVSAEALIRWHHPVRGNVRPDHFIPLAEQNGDIVGIGYWIIERACSDALQWPEPWQVSVNISPRQLKEPAFCFHLDQIMRRTGMPPDRLKLEITETSVLEDNERVKHNLETIHSMGLTLSLDDFGTGYSSLTYLVKIPLDELKIDQFFVRNMEKDNNMAIIEMTVQLSKAFNLKITAEGVETQAQADLLKKLGCDRFQGYLYSKPISQLHMLNLADEATIKEECA